MLTWIELSRKAVVKNFQVFHKLVQKKQIVAPILKANAYGHGIEQIYDCLKSQKPTWIGVNYVYEGAQLRRFGFKGRILVVGPTPAEECPAAYKHKLDILVRDFESLQWWLKAKNKPLAHIKFDTGMNRQGFLPGAEKKVIEAVLPHKKFVAGIATHFANVEDVLEHEYADLQLERYEKASAAFHKAGFKLIHHTASSASTLILPKSRNDLVRVGISLYGQWPSQATRLSFLQTYDKVAQLQPVLSWRTKVAAIKPVRAGEYIGYGCTFRAVSAMQVAVLPLGYYEGFPRLAGNDQSYVLIKGQRCKVVGRICMNMMMVDVTHLSSVKVGDLVTLIGTDGKETLSAGDVAHWAQTIHYELLTRLHPDIPRRIVD